MTALKEKITNLSGEIESRLIEIRRHLHQHPELSFQEYETSKYIQSILTEWKIPFESVADTGILASIEGKSGDNLLVLRGDMDALPIVEDTGLPFASKNEGVMHACGHDIHSTCVLGAAYIINSLRDDFSGVVKVLFQPGEELLPGGATKVISSGKLDQPQPNAMIGQHVFPELPAGKLGFRSGRYMASSDEIYINVTGSGGHAALVHQHDNIVYLTSKLIQRIQEEIESRTPEEIPTVIRFGKFIGQGATNVIASSIQVEGTLRTMDEAWRAEAHKIMSDICNEVFEGENAQCELNIVKGYPVLFNHESLTHDVYKKAVEYLGEENVVDLDIRMTAEDFAYYSQRYNTCFYRIGVGTPGDKIRKLHAPDFIADESAIKLGSGFMAYSAIDYLS